MTNTRITKDNIIKTVREMVENAVSYKTFVADFYAYATTLVDTNYVLIWTDEDTFEVFNVVSCLTYTLDYSKELENLD